jgi:tetratricopeptide (TPR) repeat protein
MKSSNDTDELLKQALGALEKRQYAEAEALQRKAVDLLRQCDAADVRIPRALEQLAGIHFAQGKFESADSQYQEVLRLDQKRLPADDRVTWRVLYWLGMSQFNHQDYEVAEANFRRALSVAEQLPENSGDLATSLYRLGFTLYFVGKYPAAEPYLLRALSLYQETKGITDICTIEVLTRIALTYEHCPTIGKDPETYLRQAVDASKPEGETSTVHVENLCRLAEHVAKRGRLEEADELFSKLLNLLNSKDSDGSNSHWVISDCIEYFKSRGKIETVKELVAAEQGYDAYGEITRDRLKHAEQALSENDSEFAEALFASANQLMFAGKYEQSDAQLRRALDSYQKIHGNKSVQVVTALNRLCVVTRLLKKFDEAEASINSALLIARENFVDQYVYPRSLENLALLREAQGTKGDATKFYAQAVAEMERISGFPSYETSEVLYRQGGHLFRAGEFRAAEAAIQRAISAMDKINELSGYEKSDYYSTLASILEAQGRNGEAAELFKRAQELFDRTEQENRTEE